MQGPPGYARIVLATDYSVAAANAARMAARLAAQPADVTAVHVIARELEPSNAGLVPAGHFAMPAIVDRAQDRARLRTWCREAGLDRAHVEVHEGVPGRGILRAAAASQADLVVMGATGHSAVERVMLGTTSLSVLQDAVVDVLLVRGEAPPDDAPLFRRIVLATDFSLHSTEAAARAAALAEATGADVTLCHVRERSLSGTAIDVAAAEPRLVEANDHHFGGRARLLLVEGDPSRALRRIVRSIDADLLVIGNKGGGRLAGLLLGSVAQDLAEKAPCTLLVVRPGAATG